MIGFDGRMTGDIPAEYLGLTEDEAAAKVVEWLKEHDQLEKREAYRHSVGHCERTHTRIQPLVMLQWWCDMKPMAAPAIEAIESGRVTYHPPVHNKVALDWLKAIRPWNVSRQLWWGHQLTIRVCTWFGSCWIQSPVAENRDNYARRAKEAINDVLDHANDDPAVEAKAQIVLGDLNWRLANLPDLPH